MLVLRFHSFTSAIKILMGELRSMPTHGFRATQNSWCRACRLPCASTPRVRRPCRPPSDDPAAGGLGGGGGSGWRSGSMHTHQVICSDCTVIGLGWSYHAALLRGLAWRDFGQSVSVTWMITSLHCVSKQNPDPQSGSYARSRLTSLPRSARVLYHGWT